MDQEVPHHLSCCQSSFKILNEWQGLGYYSRARNIHKSARIIRDTYHGNIPKDPAILRKLPGFGPYTVGAVLSIAYNIKLPIIDANVRRVVMRQLKIRGYADAKHDKKIIKFLESTLPDKNIGDYNQALMELGAMVCRSREALCNICPVRGSCLAYKGGVHELIPTPKKKIIKNVDVAVAILKRNGSYFIQKRGPKGLFADLWEFPGGKIERGESSKEAIVREIREELDIEVSSADEIMDVKQYYTEFKAHLNVFSCQTKTFPKVDKTHKWVKFKDLSKYPMPSGSAKIVDQLIIK